MESDNNPIAKKNEAITKALKLPSGAKFHRCALQVNPFSYGSKFRGQSNASDAETHARAIVEKAVKIGVSVLAITNHNDVSGVPLFRDAAARPGYQSVSRFRAYLLRRHSHSLHLPIKLDRI